MARHAKSEFHPGIGFVGPVTPAFARFTRPPVMVESGDPCTTRLVKEDVGTRAIPAELATILAAHFLTVCENGAALTVENCSRKGTASTPDARYARKEWIPSPEQFSTARAAPFSQTVRK